MPDTNTSWIKNYLRNGNPEKALALIKKSKKIDKEEDGTTILHESEEFIFDRRRIVKMLVEAGADVNVGGKYKRYPLDRAAYYGYLDVVRVLLEAGADPNVKDNIIHGVIHGGYIDVIELLLDNGADPNKEDKFGDSSPIEEARRCGYYNIAELLKRKGAKK